MARTGWWLVVGALVLAACGGGDDDATPDSTDAGAPSDEGSAVDVGSTSADGTSSTLGPDAGDDSGEGGLDEGASNDQPAQSAPTLEPSVTFAVPTSASTTRGGVIAVSPTGDRVAAMSFDDSLTGSVTIFDAATGNELTATTDVRLAGALFWTADDRLLTGGVQGEVWAWDTSTLQPTSEEPLSSGDNFCGNSSGIMFDPGAGALFLLSSVLCRIDATTGEVIVHEAEPDLLGDLRVAIGGDEVYLKWVTDDNVLMTRVVDADTLETVADEEGLPNYVAAASRNGRVEQLSGNDKVVQPSGREIGFFGPVVTPSAGGGYYFGDAFDALTVISSVDGSTVGAIDTSEAFVREVDWSADDTVMVTRTDEGVTVYEIG